MSPEDQRCLWIALRRNGTGSNSGEGLRPTLTANVEYVQKDQVGCHILKRFNTDMIRNFNLGGL